MNSNSRSVAHCRPLSLEYSKETKSLVLAVKSQLDMEIKNLSLFEFDLGDGLIVSVKFHLILSLIDGKINSIITGMKNKFYIQFHKLKKIHFLGTSSQQCCPICHCLPSDMNILENIENGVFNAVPNALNYGISTLHAHIRLFEALLHLSYRLHLKTNQLRGEENKNAAANRKRELQQRFLDKMKLRVDFPAKSGGNTNCGNTARKAFKDPKILASILNLDEQLVTNFRDILIAITITQPIDPQLFRELCMDTARIWVSKYGWYNMPCTVHKILIHGSDIMANSILPLGFLSEEAAESANKLYRNLRETNCRKTSQEDNLSDLIHRRLEASDPIVVSIIESSQSKCKKSNDIPASVSKMIMCKESVGDVSQEEEGELTDDESENVSGEELGIFDRATISADMVVLQAELSYD